MSEKSRLKRAADYFFSTEAKDRGEVARFAEWLTCFGETVVVGGMLRDLCLSGNGSFSSDVDFTCCPEDLRAFDRALIERGARRNRFGGFSLVLSAWKVDVWPLQRTWADVEGHVTVRRLEDVLLATFFTWDAILYDCESKRLIHSDRYFDDLKRRLLDINLRPNPNPSGNAIRALRYSYRLKAHLSPRLSAFVLAAMDNLSWGELVSRECASFSSSVLRSLDPSVVVETLRDSVERDRPAPPLSGRQLELRFEEEPAPSS